MSDFSVTYGPAQERRTRIPISFEDIPTAGRYSPPSIIDKVLSIIPYFSNRAAGTIRVNPANTNDVSGVIRHEAIHGALNNINQSGQLDSLNAQNAAYKILAARFPRLAGEPNQEIPAYAATGETSSLGIDPSLVTPYITKLISQLQTLDPRLAEKYKELAK